MAGTSPLRLGTRASPLALAQTDAVIAALGKAGVAAKAVTFSTRGDRDLTKPLHELGDKGLFTAELEAALHAGHIDAAVHSAKDMSALDDSDLPLVAALPRASTGDVMVSLRYGDLASIPAGARIGTASLRRAAQVQDVRPDLQVVSVRGNLQTRLRKLAEGQAEALILAAAGLERLNLGDGLKLAAMDWLPAPCQGIIAVQARQESALWQQVSHGATFTALHIERAGVRGLGAHCRLPVACHLSAGAQDLRLQAWVGGRAYGSTQRLSGERSARVATAEAQGASLRALLPAAFFVQ